MGGGFLRERFAGALARDVFLAALPRAFFRALFLADGRDVLREPPFAAFFAFFATLKSSSTAGSRREAGSYNSALVQARRSGAISPSRGAGVVKSAGGPRVAITPEAGELTIDIRPLVRSPAWRRRLAALAAIVVCAALFGAARLVPLWETSLRRGNFSELPLPILLFLTLAVGISTPLTLLGLAALAFAEERVGVDAREIVISTTAFERTRVRRIPREELDCWRETYLPLPPWWTWTVKRLAAKSRGRLYPLAGGAGPKEKRAIGVALARATGRPLLGDFGRVVSPSPGGPIR